MQNHKIKRYLLTIKLVKLVTLIIVALFVCILVFNIIHKMSRSDAAIDKKSKKTLVSNIIQNVAKGIRLYGQDKKNQPFSIFAVEVFQKSDNKVNMKSIYAKYLLNDLKTVAIKADTALVDQDLKLIHISNNIAISMDDFYNLKVDQAQIDYNNTTLKGNNNVVLEAKFGKIESQSFEIKNDYQDIDFFGGKVKTTLYIDSKNES